MTMSMCRFGYNVNDWEYSKCCQLFYLLTVYDIRAYCAKVLQVAQLSQRDRAAGWVSNGQKWKTGTERQYLRTI